MNEASSDDPGDVDIVVASSGTNLASDGARHVPQLYDAGPKRPHEPLNSGLKTSTLLQRLDDPRILSPSDRVVLLRAITSCQLVLRQS